MHPSHHTPTPDRDAWWLHDMIANLPELIGIEPRTLILAGGAAAACGFAMVLWNAINERRSRKR